MARHSRLVLLSGMLLFTLLLSLACPMSVYAEDGTPPPATEEPAQPPAEGEVEVVPEADSLSPIAEGEGQAPTEAPVATEAPVVEEAAATEAPVEEADGESLIAGNEESEVSEVPDEAEELTVGEVLEAAPEGTEVVALDENGEALPLVSEEAAGIAATVDPMWCPTGETPLNDAADGSVECRSFGTPQLLIDDMDATPALYSQNGTIYFTPDSGGAFLLNEDAIGLSLASWNALRGFDLTLQGGWNGDSAAGFAVDPAVGTVFNGGDLIKVGLGNPWVGDLTIKDITIDGASETGLWVFTQGDIDLEHVTSNNPGELYGAYLTTGDGDIRVANSSFNLHNSDGLRTWAVNGSIMLTDVNATGNGSSGAQGQAGGTGGIRVTGGSFSNNGADGLRLWSDSGDITLSGVTADDNGFHGALLDTCLLVGGVCTGSGSIVVDSSSFGDGPDVDPIGNFQSGLTVRSAGSVEVTGSDFYQNLSDGLSATAYGGSIRLEGVTAHGNMSDGASLDSTGDINIHSSIFGGGAGSGNGLSGSGMGLESIADGSVTLSGVTVSDNVGDGGAFLSGLGPVDVSGSHFDENPAVGLAADSDSSITLSQVSANQNGFFGANLVSVGSIVIGESHFDENAIVGLVASSDSSLTLSQVFANQNGFLGASLASTGRIVISDSYFDGNATLFGGWNLVADSDESITLDHVSASNNLNGDGALLVTSGNATVVCSQFQNNAGIAVDGFLVNGAFTLNDVTFGGNGTDYDGTPVFMSGGCAIVTPPPSPTPTPTNDVPVKNPGENPDPSLLLHIVPVSGDENIALNCRAYSGTKLVLPNGDRVIFPCPLRDYGTLTGKAVDQLPEPLAEEFEFLSALDAGVIRDDETLLTLETSLIIDFVIPRDQQGANLAILRWDAEQSQWVEIPHAYQTEDGRFVAGSSFTGAFVLVTK